MKFHRIAWYMIMGAAIGLLLGACQAADAGPAASELPVQPKEAPQQTTDRQSPMGEVAAPVPQLLFQRETVFDEETGIRHSVLDDQGQGINVSFEIPVFEETAEGWQKINAFFQELEDDFFSEKNESLLFAWERAAAVSHDTDYIYENSVTVYTKTEKLLSVGVYFYWNMGGVNDTGGRCYTFSPETGELLRLSDLVVGTEKEALEALYSALEELENEGPPLYWDKIRERTLNDLDFFIYENNVYIDFDRYEVAEGAAGSITVLLPVALKDVKK